MDINQDDDFKITPIATAGLIKKSMKLEHVIIDSGLDFIEEKEISKKVIPAKSVLNEFKNWCEENKLSHFDIYFLVDTFNIKILGADRPLIFVSPAEAFLTAFTYFFIFGLCLGAGFLHYWSGFQSYLGPALAALITLSVVYGFLIQFQVRARRNKLFLPDWESFTIRVKLRE